VLALVLLAVVSISTRQTTSMPPTSWGTSAVAPASAESSAFTCAGFTEGASSSAPGSVLLTNAGPSAASVGVTVFDDLNQRTSFLVTVPSGRTIAVDISARLSGGSAVAADLVVDGGGVGVSEQIERSGEATTTPCASSTSPTWYLTGGITPEFASLSYALVNPSATPAVVDVSFSTANGLVVPPAAQGLVVRARGMVVLLTDQVLPHEDILGATVSATQGSIVAFATQQTTSPPGTSVSLGQSVMSTSWYLAQAVATPGVTSSLVIDNPASTPSDVTVRVQLATGPVTPWTQSVAAHTIWKLDVSPASRVPLTDTFAATVTATGAGVAAVLLTQVPHAGSGGWGVVPLVQPAATQPDSWLLPGSLASTPLGITLRAVGTRANVTVSVLKRHGRLPIPGLTGVTIAPGALYVLPPAALAAIAGHPVVVSSSGALSVGEDLPGGAAPGTATISGLPLRPN
jgi:hypothetical protein